jgi:anionic cell wall polymer biosynthesis LytR-Cps2A-Psr (LCP) family protein
MSAEENYITSSGNLHLNGVQTVGYCRIRYVGYMDFDRTERQRRVLITMASTLRSRNVTEINNFLNTALPKVTHNISSDTLASLLMNASTYLGYSINTYRVPFDGQYHYSGEILVPDFTYTIGTLYNIIYY